MRVAGCVLDALTRDVTDALFAADLAREGSWPAAGGWRDQAQALLEAVRCVWREEALAEKVKR